IVDEAHKSRGHETGLNRLLERLILQTPNGRRLCITATPIELGIAQWEGMLARVGVPLAESGKTAIREYAAAVRAVRALPTSEPDIVRFAQAAKAFHRLLR